ncbi:MAG: c-type cytochrome [Paracoccaceae bacterium]
MKINLALVAAGLALAAPAFADSHDGMTGDPAKGEKAFRQCVACHTVQNDAGEKLAGRGAKTGPNLYGLPGRKAGHEDGFRYSTAMQEAADNGLVWTEDNFIAYVQDPTAFLRDFSGDNSVRSNMTFKLRHKEDAPDIYAYLAKLAAE